MAVKGSHGLVEDRLLLVPEAKILVKVPLSNKRLIAPEM
jgi:hypothetical protein